MMQYLLTAEGRRAAALLLMAGAGMVMTIYAAFALYLVRDVATDVLALGLSAHVIVFVVVTGFAGLLVKRMIKASIPGGSFEATDKVDPNMEKTNDPSGS